MSEASNPLFADQGSQPLPAIETQMIPKQLVRIPLDAEPIAPAEQFGIVNDPEKGSGNLEVIGQFSLGRKANAEETGVPLFLTRRQLDNNGIHFDYYLMGAKEGPDGRIGVDTDGFQATPLNNIDLEKEVIVGRTSREIEGTNEYGKELVKMPIDHMAMEITGRDERSARVSRAHMGIRYQWGQGGGIYVRDYGSSNGTVRVEYPVQQPGEYPQEVSQSMDREPDTEPEVASENIGRVASVHLIDVGDVPSSARNQDSNPEIPIRDQALSRIAELTGQIEEDPEIGEVAATQRWVQEVRKDMQDNWADSRRAASQQSYHNHGAESTRLQQQLAGYERELEGMKRDGRYARYTADPRVVERLDLYAQLRAK